jgi:hypothetical protein
MRINESITRNLVAAFLMFFMLIASSREANAAVTSLLLDSEPGDYIGGGQRLFFGSSDGTFTAQRNFANGVSISFSTPSFEHWWYLDFAAPSDEFLTPGIYTGAVRFPFQGSDQPGLSVYGDGRGCNTLTGSFQVMEVTYGLDSDVTSFRATFEQHCEGASPALRGEIRFNATVTIELTAPASISINEGQNLTFNVTANDVQGRHVALTATGLPLGATFVDNGDNTGTFSWIPSAGQAGIYTVAFHGDNGQGDTETIFTLITVAAPPPLNDDLNNAIVVPGVPFAFTEDTRTATIASDDPFCAGRSATVWFAFTPSTDMRIEANTFGSAYDTTLSVYTGTRGALIPVACNDDASGSQSRVRFDALVGVTYFFMVSAYGAGQGGNLVFNVTVPPPPLTISLALPQFGSVVPTTGVATVNGTVRCSRPTFVSVFGEIKQKHADGVLNGFFSAFVACDGLSPWSATVQLPPRLFHGRAVELFVAGKTSVTASAFAFDPDAGEPAQSNVVTTVILKGSR